MGKIIMNKKTLILLAMSLVGTQAWAGSVTVPNTFVDGTTASASEVNANFDAVKTAVDDNNARINTNAADIQTNVTSIQDNTSAISNIRGINVYVDDVRRGALIDSFSGAGQNNFITAIGFRILLDSKYFATFSPAGDGLRQIALRYESTDCTGQPYLPMDDWNPLIPKQGIVFSNDTPALGTLYYVQAGTVRETVTIESVMMDGVCNLFNVPNVNASKVFVNDSALTGVTHSDFIGDVTVGF